MEEKKSHYLHYLPAVYQQPEITGNAPGAEDFLGRYLEIFEKIFSGLNDQELHSQKGIEELLASGIIGNLFYPRFSFLFPHNSQFIPALNTSAQQNFSQYIPRLHNNFPNWLNEFVQWLSQWVALKLDETWDIDTKRLLIAKIMPIYRIRGTLQGLQQLLNLSITQGEVVTVNVRKALEIPALQVGVNFVLDNRYLEGQAVLGGKRPWLFIVNVHMNLDTSIENIQAMIHKITALINLAKPEFSYFKLNLFPTLKLGERATLGKDAILGNIPMQRICLGVSGNLGKTAFLV